MKTIITIEGDKLGIFRVLTFLKTAGVTVQSVQNGEEKPHTFDEKTRVGDLCERFEEDQQRHVEKQRVKAGR
jgi:hypothetical protein